MSEWGRKVTYVSSTVELRGGFSRSENSQKGQAGSSSRQGDGDTDNRAPHGGTQKGISEHTTRLTLKWTGEATAED